MSKKLYTYNTPPEEAIQIGWKIYDRDVPADGVIKSWKKNADLDVKVGMFANASELRACIAPGAKLAFYLTYHSLKKWGGTGLQGGDKVLSFEETGDTQLDCDIEYTIPGEELAGTVELAFIMALEGEADKRLTTCATQVGSIIYENRIVIHLEGNQALFPVKAIDFSVPEIARPNALYYLNRKFKQLNSNFNSSYTLYFNSSHPLFKKINMDSQNESSNQYLLRTIMYDVYRTIVLDALDEVHGLTEIQIPENDEDCFSLSAVYSRIVGDIIRIYFPEKDLVGMKKMISDEESRNRLLTAIQDYILGE